MSRFIGAWCLATALCALPAAGQGLAAVPEYGVPVTEPLIIQKCGSCHARDQNGMMERISSERTTPEGWQDVLRRMIVTHNIAISPLEARSIVKYLSTRHGLAPEEARPVQFDAERRIRDEADVPGAGVRKACAQCHHFARALAWRRSAGDWAQFGRDHAASVHAEMTDEIRAFLIGNAPLQTPAWTAWSSQPRPAQVAGRWLVTASLPGRGRYSGEMLIEEVSGGEFTTTARLTSVGDGSVIERRGRSVVYAGYAWRGRSQGSAASSGPNDPLNEAREVMWFAPDQSFAEGRWFWGQYQEFGFDVHLVRAGAGPTLLSISPTSLAAGSSRKILRLQGDRFPSGVKSSDLDLGAMVTVDRVVSSDPGLIVLEVSVNGEAQSGRRSLRLGGLMLKGGLTVYDRIDYLQVIPESALGAFGDSEHPPGYQPFTASAFHRGADGKVHTEDDLDLGSIDVTWSFQVFHDADGAMAKRVGTVNREGLFIPATVNPESNFDTWVIATASAEKGRSGRPLVGKCFLVVTVPTYSLNGRRFVRDRDHWVDEGPSQ